MPKVPQYFLIALIVVHLAQVSLQDFHELIIPGLTTYELLNRGLVMIDHILTELSVSLRL